MAIPWKNYLLNSQILYKKLTYPWGCSSAAAGHDIAGVDAVEVALGGQVALHPLHIMRAGIGAQVVLLQQLLEGNFDGILALPRLLIDSRRDVDGRLLAHGLHLFDCPAVFLLPCTACTVISGGLHLLGPVRLSAAQ